MNATADTPVDVIDLPDTAATDVTRTGGKAATLARLKAAGFAVPDGFVIAANAFDLFRESSGIQEEPYEATIRTASLPDDTRRVIRQALETMGDGSVAVRSSGIAEDGAQASLAGQYETILDVRGAAHVETAVLACWASAYSERVADYQHGEQPASLAVLVQQMVPADSAGVAFSADPITGKGESVVVSAVKGLGDRLVSGEATPDEWLVRDGIATRRRSSEDAISDGAVLEIADLARRVEAWAGTPQDIEWAISGGQIWLLQARPITVLPDQADWTPPVDGVWTRNFRLGEWIPDPLTPLFASWLLPRIERSFASFYATHVTGGLVPPEPHHLIVNGWYFSTLNFLPRGPLSKAAAITKLIRWAIRRPRSAAMMIPPTARYGVRLFLDDWRRRLHPEYQDTVENARARLPGATPSELVDLIDELADAAGEYFASITLVAGYAWKAELPLAAFWRKHLADLNHGHQETLIGFGGGSTYEHAVECLDWFHATLGETDHSSSSDNPSHDHATQRRQTIEAEARRQLTGTRRAGRFDKLLATAQEYATIREEQVRGFTLPWPFMREAAARLGTVLQSYGALSQPEAVFHLTYQELTDALLGGQTASLDKLVEVRRAERERQRKLTPPPVLGKPSKFLQVMFSTPDKLRSGDIPEDAIQGQPASPGRVIGTARVILSLDDADRLRVGDILVTAATTPAWTPLFRRAAAVVTDLGSVVAHASLVAREYGIPAVVGADNATNRIADGTPVLVDGQGGYVELLGSDATANGKAMIRRDR